jgi:hypothetical protein
VSKASCMTYPVVHEIESMLYQVLHLNVLSGDLATAWFASFD